MHVTIINNKISAAAYDKHRRTVFFYVSKAELYKKYLEEQLPVFLDGLEKLLTENNGGNGYFVGDDVSFLLTLRLHFQFIHLMYLCRF